MGLLQDRVALVSGIGPGLGAEMTLAFAREGAHIAMAARSEDTMIALAKEVEALGRKVVWQSTDIRDADACKSLVERVNRDLGRLDILANNAFRKFTEQPLADSDIDDWRKAVEVNFLGTLNMTQAVIPTMKAQKSGRIIMVSTMGTRNLSPGQGPYASTKAAINSVTKTLARELGPDGIRVNALVPGWIWGPNAEEALQRYAEAEGRDLDEIVRQYADQTALKYLPEGSEIAGAAVFLASDLSNSVTGHLLDANAGQWM